ncbi:MAG: molybdopterin adenylyltransferase [Planctomycetota bacterium]|nr:molybdopterin adenylyltransferase [Planctomycetota bacterium]
MSSDEIAPIGILTISDRVSRGEYEDRGGPAVQQWLQSRLRGSRRFDLRTVPDEIDAVTEILQQMASRGSLIVTTGGTGIGPRDITPEAMKAACHSFLPGFGEKMRAASWQAVPTAILSRATAGLIEKCLVINLPGNPRAIGECLESIWSAIPHAIEIIGGSIGETLDAAPDPHSTGDNN